MKKAVALFTFFLFISTIIKAQDTIIKINGDTVIAKISEITPTEIKYKKFNFQEGPIYIESKSEIKEINYSNGLKEKFAVQEIKSDTKKDYYNPNAVFVDPQKKLESYGAKYKYDGRRIGEREMQGLLMATKDKQITEMVQKAKDAKAMQQIGFAGIPLSIASIVFLFSSIDFGGTLYGNTSIDSRKLTASGILLCAAIACPIASGVFKHKRIRLNTKAVQLYNQRY